MDVCCCIWFLYMICTNRQNDIEEVYRRKELDLSRLYTYLHLFHQVISEMYHHIDVKHIQRLQSSRKNRCT